MQLRPFTILSESDPLARLSLEAEVFLQGDRVHFEFTLQGTLSAIRFGDLPRGDAGNPSVRADGLWKSTCFEAFVGHGEGEGYLEFNVAPSGLWNCYRFDGYRRGMRPESAVQFLAVRADLPEEPGGERALLGWSVPLAALGGGLPEDLRIGLTAVIEDARGGISHWAIAHAGGKADFHMHQSFVARPVRAAPGVRGE